MFSIKLPKIKRLYHRLNRSLSVFGLRLLLALNLVCGWPLLVLAQAPEQAVTDVVNQDFDENRMWLPLSYKRYFGQLKRATQAVANLERCSEVRSASLETNLSRKQAPVFKVVCRDNDKRTFAMKVDGNSQDILDSRFDGGRISFADYLAELEFRRQEKLRLEELRRQEQERQAELERQQAEQQRQEDCWQQCQALLAERTKHMRELTWLTTEMPEPDLSRPEHLIYRVDFDARDLRGRSLRYRATCDAQAEDKIEVKIRPRRD